MPDESFFFTSGLSAEELRVQTLVGWRKTKNPGSLKKMLEYRRTDVEVLRLVCLKYFENMRQLSGFCPLTKSTTLAVFVVLPYHAKFMPKVSIALLLESSFESRKAASFKSLEWFFI